MKIIYQTEMTIIVAPRDGKIVWDGGCLRIKEGQIIAMGEFGFSTYRDLDDLKQTNQVIDCQEQYGPEEEELCLAFEKGYG